MWSLKTVISLTSLSVLLGAAVIEKETERKIEALIQVDEQHAPPCIKLYRFLDKYSEEYGVPFEIAIGVASEETGYRGPFHWSYNPKRTSSAAAYGAMQIQVPTANDNWDEPVTSKMLMNDLELNVQISMRLLARLKKKYGRWDIALGAYNSGRPIINGYATRIASGQSNPLEN
jgi:soluble lytic murein transglycosylase-like protein